MRRLTITLLLVVLVAIFGLGFLLDSVFERYQGGSDAEGEDEISRVQSFANGLAATLNQSDSPVEIIDKWPESAEYKIAIESKDELSLPASLLEDFESGEPLLLESDAGISLHFYLSNHKKVLSLETSAPVASQNRSMALVFTGLFYLGTLLLVLLWLKPLLYRLNLLRSTARSFGSGDLGSRVDQPGLSYIRDIEDDFNGMADQIQQLVDDNKLLSSAVSHDLRTPLARLRFGIDTLAEADTDTARKKYLSRINGDLNEMESLVNSLLRYARLDNVMEGVEKEPVSLRQLLQECVGQYYDVRTVIRVDDSDLRRNDELQVIGCIEHLAMLLNNLIQNAVDHADKRLVVEFKRTDTNIEVAFCDDGQGIPVAIREKVMKPFQRGEAAGNASYGLGLAVVARIARHHDAVVAIQQCKRLGGARISVVFSSR